MRQFNLAGADLDWPIGSAAGMTNHPDIESVATRFNGYASAGLSFVVLGSWTVGAARGGNGFIRVGDHWETVDGDEYVDLRWKTAYNAKNLPNPGTDIGMPRLEDFVDLAASRGVEAGLSLSPHTNEPLSELKEIISLAGKALTKNVLFVEVNLSCPNLEDGLPFYQDMESMIELYDYISDQPTLLNKYGEPGIYFKDGPMSRFNLVMTAPLGYGRVACNTVEGKQPRREDGELAIKVNGGRAGQSGPALRLFGRQQTKHRVFQREISDYPEAPIISTLGVNSGHEVYARLECKATAVELGSILYWPELVGCESPGEVVEQVKQEFVEAMPTNI